MWVLPGRACEDALGGVLVPRSLEDLSLHEQRVARLRHERRIPLVEELRMEDNVRLDFVERVSACLLGRAVGRFGVPDEAGAEESRGVVELHHRIVGCLQGEWL